MLEMLLDHTHTLMLKESSSRLPTLLELMDSRSTPTTYQLLQLLILSFQLLQCTQELLQLIPELHLGQFRIHLRLLLLKLLTLSSWLLLVPVRSVPFHTDSHMLDTHTHMATSDTPTTDMPASDMPHTDIPVPTSGNHH